MDEEYIAAIDQGTTGTRFIVFGQDGSIAGSSYTEHNQIYPKPRWVEHDPLEIWQKSQMVIKQTLETTGIHPEKIVSIGVTNQRETTMIWDRYTGKPVCTRNQTRGNHQKKRV